MTEIVGCVDKPRVVELFARHVSSGKVAFFQAAGIDFVLGRREGPFLWDLDGKTRLIDCHCNGGVFNLGHRHPEVIAALEAGLRELDIGNHHLMSEQRALLARRLAELTWEDGYTVFGVGGGEAIDLAIKLARGYTGRSKVISARGGYHGHTGLALAAGDEKYRAPFGPPAPGFVQVPFNDVDALAAEMRAGDAPAAVILETIPATLGMVIADAGYYPAVRRLCDEMGALLISDEVQTGLGRTGRLWAFQHFGVTPDILVIGKGLSGGVYPITATCFRARLESVFHPDPFIHVSTFGGAEVGCRVALKVLEISSEETFLAHVNAIAGVFASGLAALAEKHAGVFTGVRQKGLMMGLELAGPQFGPFFTKAAFDNGLLAIYANNDPRVVQLLPPLIIERPLALEILERVDAALGVLERMV